MRRLGRADSSYSRLVKRLTGVPESLGLRLLDRTVRLEFLRPYSSVDERPLLRVAPLVRLARAGAVVQAWRADLAPGQAAGKATGGGAIKLKEVPLRGAEPALHGPGPLARSPGPVLRKL